MAYPIRQFDTHDTWFITSRCFQARMLMTPHSALVRDVTGGVLARAAEKYGVQLYAYSFLSNHFHLVIHAHGLVIADFMRFLQANLSKKLARLVRGGWRGRFWERRYSAEPILDEGALERSVRYVVAHSVKEGLVAHPTHWEGLHCARQLLDAQPREYRWFDWTKRWHARRSAADASNQDNGPYAEKFAQPLTLRLRPLPQWERLPAAEQLRLARTLVDEAAERRPEGKRPIGMQAVKRQDSGLRKWSKRSPRPMCHVSGPSQRHAEAHYRGEYSVFLAAYRAASRDWRRGKTDVEFPSGSFKPGVKWASRIV